LVLPGVDQLESWRCRLSHLVTYSFVENSAQYNFHPNNAPIRTVRSLFDMQQP
jgi:hypothetical protein